MASFGFYSDAALTQPLSTWTRFHTTDGALDPVDKQIWFGSTDGAKKAQAASNPGVDQIVLSIAYVYPARANSEPVTAGERRRLSTSNNRLYEANNNGTTAASAPIFPTTINDTVVDGSVTWKCLAYEDTTDEIKLAAVQANLGAATAGAPLNLGVTILGGVANAVSFWARATDPDLVVQTTTQLKLAVNTINESAYP